MEVVVVEGFERFGEEEVEGFGEEEVRREEEVTVRGAAAGVGFDPPRPNTGGEET